MIWHFKNSSFKHALAQYDGTLPSLKQTNAAMATLLRTEKCFRLVDPTLISALEAAETETQTNRVLSGVYDYADRRRIWLGFGDAVPASAKEA